MLHLVHLLYVKNRKPLGHGVFSGLMITITIVTGETVINKVDIVDPLFCSLFS